jgi:hypothetical protein
MGGFCCLGRGEEGGYGGVIGAPSAIRAASVCSLRRYFATKNTATVCIPVRSADHLAIRSGSNDPIASGNRCANERHLAQLLGWHGE